MTGPEDEVGPKAYRQRVKTLRGGRVVVEVWFEIRSGAAVATRRTWLQTRDRPPVTSVRRIVPGWAK